MAAQLTPLQTLELHLAGIPAPLPSWETNPNSHERAVIWKCRHLQGPTNTLVGLARRGLCRIGVQVELPVNTKITYMHWGLQIGPYLYELRKQGSVLASQRVHVDDAGFWASDVPNQEVGTTNMQDQELEALAEGTIGSMEGSGFIMNTRGGYKAHTNNCQHFVWRMFHNIVCRTWDDDDVVEDDIYPESKFLRTMMVSMQGLPRNIYDPTFDTLG